MILGMFKNTFLHFFSRDTVLFIFSSVYLGQMDVCVGGTCLQFSLTEQVNRNGAWFYFYNKTTVKKNAKQH